MPGYLEVRCECPPQSAELIFYYISENMAPGGLEDLGSEDHPVARFFLADDENGEAQLLKFMQYLDTSGLVAADQLEQRLTSRSISEQDWLAEYQQKFGAVIVDDIVIKPSWDNAEFPDKQVILMDPKMAFGTGRHATTQLCLRQVRDDIRPGDRVLDFGCGSGILSILAAQLGAAKCHCIDNDPEAVEGALENVKLNAVADKLEIKPGSIEQVDKTAHYDLVVSNLIYKGLLEYYDQLEAAAKPDSVIILSGILGTQERPFMDFLQSRGVTNTTVTHLEEWSCIRIARGNR